MIGFYVEVPGACIICGAAGHDEPWATLAGLNPGPKMRTIGRVRHGLTGLQAMGRCMPDDEGAQRCLTCLRVVPSEKLIGGGRIQVGPFSTGYELLCCGATP